MINIPYADSQGQLSVEVHLEHTADVFLVDSANFQKYKSGNRFKYYGGNYNKSPVTITVNGYGRWYLVVQGSAYKYRFY